LNKCIEFGVSEKLPPPYIPSPNGVALLRFLPFVLLPIAPIIPAGLKGLEAPKNSAKISSAFLGLNLDEFVVVKPVALLLLKKPCVVVPPPAPLEFGDGTFPFNPSSP
jgi:hypothetical protein